jgi:hypothetical protein
LQEFSQDCELDNENLCDCLVLAAAAAPAAAMKRYLTRRDGTLWTVVDRWAADPGAVAARPLTGPAAADLADVLNSLDAQESWRREARRWPQAVG